MNPIVQTPWLCMASANGSSLPRVISADDAGRGNIPPSSLKNFLDLYPHPALAFEPGNALEAGRILQGNIALLRTLALRSDEAPLLSHHLRRELVETLLALRPGEEFEEKDVHLITADGCQNCFDLNGAVHFLSRDGGKGLGFLFFTKTTERCLFRDRMMKSEDLRRVLEGTTTDAISRMTAEGVITYVSPANETITGYRPEEVVGRSAYEFIHPEDLEHIRARHGEILERSALNVFEHRLLHKDGSWRWMETRARAVRDPGSGRILEIHASQRDVTDRRNAQEESRRLRETLAVSSDFVLSVAPDGRMLYGNEALRKIRKWDANDDLSNVATDALHPAWALEQIKRTAVPTAFSEGLWMGNTALLDAAGGEIPVSMALIAHRQNGVVTHFSGVMRRIEAEPDSQSRLALQAEASALRFAGHSLAHDLNNVFAVLLANHSFLEEGLERLSGDSLPPGAFDDFSEGLKETRLATERALQMLQDFRNSGRGGSVPAVDLNVLLQPSSLALLFGSRQDLVLAPGNEPALVPGPAGELLRVLDNLVVNARDAMKGRRHPRLFIGSEKADVTEETAASLSRQAAPFEVRPGRYVRLRVRDNGEGMTEETLRRIFELGFTTKPAGNAPRGFGMTMVANFLRKVGGFVTADSRLGEGTTFDVYLPLVK
ncbi:MAG TPA: PAS domain S-box protein [bacterium]|nr:PAS domain S-box protein [bacterium]